MINYDNRALDSINEDIDLDSPSGSARASGSSQSGGLSGRAYSLTG